MGVVLPPVPPVLAGDKILLTPWEEQDLPRIVELADEVGRRWSRSLAAVRTVDDARRWVQERQQRDRVDWAVRDPGNHLLVGRFGLLRLQDHPPAAETAYGVHPAHRRRGVAAAAVATAARWAFEDLGLRRLEIVHDVGNSASCAVAARSGFSLEGLERQALGYPDGRVADMHRHARLATDPPGRVKPAPQPLEPVTLAASGLTLRPWARADADAVLAALTDPLIVRWNPRLPPRDLDAARVWVADRAARWNDGRAASWAVVEGAAPGRVLGSVALRELNHIDAYAVASYWTVPAARGEGVAVRALARATSYALEDLGLHRVQLAHVVDNVASCRVAQKAGFALEGTLRGSNRLAEGWHDEHLHARLASDGSVT